MSNKIDPDIKARWVAALRGGEYVKGTMSFERDGRFCCLGVLCVVEGQPPFDPGAGAPFGNWDFADSVMGDNDASMELAHRNDGANGYKPHSFSQIADYIEAEL